jgi:hypothetical protein
MEKRLSRKERGLGKYDAPLRMQFEKGYRDFKRGRVTNPFHPDTMQHREWQRGFDTAFADQLSRVQENEQFRTRGKTVSRGEVQNV